MEGESRPCDVLLLFDKAGFPAALIFAIAASGFKPRPAIGRDSLWAEPARGVPDVIGLDADRRQGCRLGLAWGSAVSAGPDD
jgi:hypothetical protein